MGLVSFGFSLFLPASGEQGRPGLRRRGTEREKDRERGGGSKWQHIIMLQQRSHVELLRKRSHEGRREEPGNEASPHTFLPSLQQTRFVQESPSLHRLHCVVVLVLADL